MSTTTRIASLTSPLFPESRGRILGLFFGAPDRAFYLREVAARTGLAIGQVQRELSRLSEAGILRRFRQGRHVYFQSNDRCPIFDELRRIVVKTVGAVDVVRSALASVRDQITAAFLFGSVVRQEETSKSDLDLMVIGDCMFADIVAAIRAAEPVVQREIHPTVYPVQEFVAKYRNGNHFLLSVVSGEKMFVLGNDDDLRKLLEQSVDTSA
jgi:predicted nucleotidyltransferase